MKKYKLFIDCPWGHAGTEISPNSEGLLYYGLRGSDRQAIVNATFSPDLYPHIFQEIKEPSDEQIVLDWLLNISSAKEIASALLKKGFKAEWVKECEHEWIEHGDVDRPQTLYNECRKCGVKK